ncbi:nucleoside-diphosphate-sugar epimerase [Asanoa ferruginea]|uniref:Nucleoside-diphosphate-sugar epimerase n=1 Tax=Asanoa ferruginea TaxID=53367 RepID=A0A3D9ZA94_9ACTN|nr:NAD(P)-dependent oxidoreductase [Asanoa ferruginea]REF94261.1 nucleoside-diphosphate-sugar epimerase [Asanoa ferruginea]GIF53342.1 NAD-dependent dehydratase [Asanoa ferruginea]
MRRVLITGGAGRIGSLLTARLAADYAVRSFDVAPQQPADGVETIRGLIGDLDTVTAACAGVDVVIHLAAIPSESLWEELVRVNIEGTRTVLEAARLAGVPKVILASSIHAAGFRTRTATPLPASSAPRPDTLYGWTKAAVESLGSLYSDRYGMTVFPVRIGAFQDTPWSEVDVPIWLSPDDCVRLMLALVETPVTGFRVVWGVSDNSSGWLELDSEVGYQPQDDSATVAHLAAPSDSAAHAQLGGTFAAIPLGMPRW